MKKIIVLVAVFATVGIVALAFIGSQDSKQISLKELREKFRCDRVTAEALATDIYCDNPDHYYEDIKNGAVIDESDFDDPRYMARSNSRNLPSSSPYGYNPNYADAIQQKKPGLCQNINYALQSTPTDAIEKVYGSKAIELCIDQAKQGFFGCLCDSKATLNAMRIR